MTQSIYEALEADHDEQRRLCDAVRSSEPGSDERSELWTQLRNELEAHASAEEQAFYSTLMAHPKGTDDTRHAIEEHQQMHEMIAELDAMDQSADVWNKLFGKLAHKVVHHVDEEEAEFFPRAQKILTDREETEAAEVFATRKSAELDKQREG